MHNYPTPPEGDTESQALLPMDLSPSTSTVLYNYDTDRDTFPGRVIQKSSQSGGVTPQNKIQIWQTPPLGQPVSLPGGVQVELWSAMKGFDLTKTGSVTVTLNDIDGGTTTVIGSATLTQSNWQGGVFNWVQKDFLMTFPSYTVPAGHSLGLAVVVNADSDDDMWFAYDHLTFSSRLSPFNVTPTPTPGVFAADFAPVADSIIRSNGGSTNFGGAAELRVDPHPAHTERSLIRFDVSTVPAGSTVASATLTLCPTKKTVPAAGRIHELHVALGEWTESAVTWGNQPTVIAAPTDSSVYLGDLECVEFNVTGEVAAWVAGAPNFGWQLRDQTEGDVNNSAVTYGSREAATTTLVPLLTLTYTP